MKTERGVSRRRRYALLLIPVLFVTSVAPLSAVARSSQRNELADSQKSSDEDVALESISRVSGSGDGDCTDGVASLSFGQPVSNANATITLEMTRDIVVIVEFKDSSGRLRYKDDALVGEPYGGPHHVEFKTPGDSLGVSNVSEVYVELTGRSTSTILSCSVSVSSSGPLTDPTALQCLTDGTIDLRFDTPQNNYRLALDVALDHDKVLEWEMYSEGGAILARDMIRLGDYYGGFPRQTLFLPDESKPAVSGVSSVHVALTARGTDVIRWCSASSVVGEAPAPGPDPGPNPAPDPEPEPTPVSDINVMTWNIRGARKPPLKNGVTPEILDRRADIVGLQEVQKHQAENLQKYLSESGVAWDMRWNRKGNWNCCWPPRREGHAILSRFDIVGNGSTGKKWRLGSNRILQRVVVNSPHGRLHVYNTHLCSGGCLPLRLEQANEIKRHVADDLASEGAGYMAVLTGDINDGPASRTLSKLKSRVGKFRFRDAWGVRFPSSVSKKHCPRGSPVSKCGWTSTTTRPVDRRDYVLVGSGLGLHEVATPFAEAQPEENCPDLLSCTYPFYKDISDHFPVIAYLNLTRAN